MSELRRIIEEQDKIAVTLKKMVSEKNNMNSEGMQLAIDMFLRQQSEMHKRISSMNNENRSKLEEEKEDAKKKQNQKNDGLLF